MNNINDIEDHPFQRKVAKNETNVGIGITHQIITDVDVLLERIKIIYKRGALNGLENPDIVKFVNGLLENEKNEKLKYNNQDDFENRSKFLRKTLRCQPRKTELSQYYQLMISSGMKERNSSLELFLRFKSARSHSGVLPVTLLTSPGYFSCPKNCHFCPDERDMNGKMVQPRSYLSSEPACKRAAQNDFDPILQFFDRCDTLQKIGHVIDKAEVLVLGGTWSFYKSEYQHEFCRRIFYCANIYWDIQDALSDKTKCNNFRLREMYSLEKEQVINETSRCRIIGITLETRPDYITKTELKKFRKYGCTRVQLGIQHTNNDILDYCNRDHHIEDAIKAIMLLKENGFKVDGHFMPDLPKANPNIDKKMIYRILNGTDLQVDYMKIYPTTITPFTQIKKWYELPDGHPDKYTPYAEKNNGKELIDVIKYAKMWMKPWIRLNRIYRDFPNQNVKTGEIGAIGGIMKTNLRQMIKNEMTKEGLICKCIRCTEVKTRAFNWDEATLFIRTYRASGGIEYFISVESPDEHIKYGFVRLRFNNPKLDLRKRLKCLNDIDSKHQTCALIRELHVYGSLVKVDSSESDASQHFGIGKRLLQEAERISYDAGYLKIAVISGVGVRNYYRKRGYELGDFGYMFKNLNENVKIIEKTIGKTIGKTIETKGKIEIVYILLFTLILIILKSIFY